MKLPAQFRGLAFLDLAIALDISDILKGVTKILVSVDEKLLARLDRAAKRAGLSRSAYLARLVERDLDSELGPGADPEVRQALADMQRMFRENPPPPDFDWTKAIRKMRDSR